MKKSLLGALLIGIILLFLGYQNYQTKKEIEKYYFVSDTLSTLQSINHDIDLFQANMLAQTNYDHIEEKLQILSAINIKIMQAIKNGHIKDEVFEQLYQRISKSIDEKVTQTQILKSLNGVITNSYRYLKTIKPSIQNQAYDRVFIASGDLDKADETFLKQRRPPSDPLEPTTPIQKSFLLHLKVIDHAYQEYYALDLTQKNIQLKEDIATLQKLYEKVSAKNIQKVSYSVIALFVILACGIILFLFDAYKLSKNTLSLKRFMKAVEDSDNIVMITDAYQKIKYVNKAYTHSTGYELNEVLGKKPSIVQSGLNTKTFYKKLHKTIYGGKTWSGTFINRSKDGKKQYERGTISPIFDDNGKIIEFVALKLNITKEIENQNALREKDRKFFEHAKIASMGELLNNIAHHWRQPLSIISTVATSIELQQEMGMLDGEKLTRGMGDINKAVQNLSSTIEDFASFFDQNRSKTYFELATIIEKGINIIQGEITNHKIKVAFYNSVSSKIYGYDSELLQAILNILTNAIDILSDKEDRAILIETKDMGLMCEILIADSGGGIPSDLMEKIFEPYFTTKHQSQGTGMGLYSTYDIVTNRLKGEIRASNSQFNIGESYYFGAQFVLKIPKENH